LVGLLPHPLKSPSPSKERGKIRKRDKASLKLSLSYRNAGELKRWLTPLFYKLVPPPLIREGDKGGGLQIKH